MPYADGQHSPMKICMQFAETLPHNHELPERASALPHKASSRRASHQSHYLQHSIDLTTIIDAVLPLNRDRLPYDQELTMSWSISAAHRQHASIDSEVRVIVTAFTIQPRMKYILTRLDIRSDAFHIHLTNEHCESPSVTSSRLPLHEPPRSTACKQSCESIYLLDPSTDLIEFSFTSPTIKSNTIQLLSVWQSHLYIKPNQFE